MTGVTISKQLTKDHSTTLIKKNSHISSIHRLVEQYNFLSSNSGTQLADQIKIETEVLRERYEGILDQFELTT